MLRPTKVLQVLCSAIGRAVLGGSSVGARVQEGSARDSTFRHIFVPPIHTTSLLRGWGTLCEVCALDSFA